VFTPRPVGSTRRASITWAHCATQCDGVTGGPQSSKWNDHSRADHLCSTLLVDTRSEWGPLYRGHTALFGGLLLLQDPHHKHPVGSVLLHQLKAQLLQCCQQRPEVLFAGAAVCKPAAHLQQCSVTTATEQMTRKKVRCYLLE